MRITRKGAESTVRLYMFEEDGMPFLHENMVDLAMDDIMRKYCNVYCGIEEGAAGSKKLVISSVNKSKMTRFMEIYIR